MNSNSSKNDGSNTSKAMAIATASKSLPELKSQQEHQALVISTEPQAYRPVEDRFHLEEALHEYLEEYNVEFPSQMHLVFFSDAIAHVRYQTNVSELPPSLP